MPSSNFTKWHEFKVHLADRTEIPHFRTREIWWTHIGQNIGNEQNGKGPRFTRPVLIVHKFNDSFFYGIPTSTTPNSGPYYWPITIAGKPTKLLLSQLRAFDARRLQNRIDNLPEPEFALVQSQIAKALGLQTK